MAVYTVKHSCGHEERHNLVGSKSIRDWRLARLAERECLACYQRATREAARQEAQAQELPALRGTEKQVGWAESLRLEKLHELQEKLEHLPPDKANDPLLQRAVEVISAETSAHQWIEWRDLPPGSLLLRVYKSLESAAATPAPATEQTGTPTDADRLLALAEATMRPASPRTETVAELHLDGNSLSVHFPEKREDFREIVKFQFGYTWSDGAICWQRTLTPKWHGLPADRAAELARALLAAGFPVRVFDEQVRQKILSGDLAPEQTRWIRRQKSGEHEGWFVLSWERQEDFSLAAKKIKRSRYQNGTVVAPPEQFEEVLDFAERYQFRLSEAAQSIAQAARDARQRMLLVQVEASPQPTHSKQPGAPTSHVPPRLTPPTSVEIPDDLREDA